MVKVLFSNLPGEGAKELARRIERTMSDPLRWDAPGRRACRRVFRDHASFEAEWLAQGGDPARMPDVDFARSMIVAVIEAKGEYDAFWTIDSVVAADGEVIVALKRSSRPWKMIDPASIIRIERAEGEVRFVEQG